MGLKEYREHIELLAHELNVTLLYNGTRYGMAANILTREVHLAPWGSIPNDELYWVALHELGHLADRDAGNDSAGKTLAAMLFGGPNLEAAEHEARAWVWALDHAHEEMDQAAESAIAWGIADRLLEGFEIGPALERIFRELGPEPDWFFNVVTPDHFAKLDGYALPRWADLTRRMEERGIVPATA